MTEEMAAVQATAEAGHDFPSISFQVEGDVFSITARCVSSIILMPEQVIHIPESPAYCKGLIELRGQVIPLIDLRTLFSIPPCGGAPVSLYGAECLVVIIEGASGTLGLTVDAVYAVETVSPIDSANSGADASHGRYVSGVGKSDKTGKTLLMLDHTALLQLSEGLQY